MSSRHRRIAEEIVNQSQNYFKKQRVKDKKRSKIVKKYEPNPFFYKVPKARRKTKN